MLSLDRTPIFRGLTEKFVFQRMLLTALLALHHPAFANIVWPALSLAGALTSVWVILAGLLTEFFFLWKVLRLSAKRTAVAGIVMNAVSATLGSLLIAAFGLLPVFLRLAVLVYTLTFIIAVMVNAALESLVIKWWFKKSFSGRDFWLLTTANTLTVAIAVGGLYFSLKFERMAPCLIV